MKKTILGLLLGACCWTACLAEMERSTPEAEGVSSTAIEKWIDACERELDALHGFVIVRHGKVIAEGWWSPFSADRTHMLYSHSKSFTSTAIGFLVDDGKLDLDESVLEIFPEKAPAEPIGKIGRLRVRDLLTMTTGMPYTDAERKEIGGDWVKLFLANEVRDQPGTKYRYDSCATHMLAAIVEKKSGMKMMDFLRTRLFDEIGITSAWTTYSPTGIPCGGWGMNMTTRELARFGQLYLQEGRWGARQLLSKKWVRHATGYQTSTQRPGDGDWSQGYGFQFWRCRHNCFRADGAYGQYTVVMPEQDTVISLNAGLGPMDKELNLVWQHLLPAMLAEPLPANPAAQKALSDRCAKLALKTVAGAKEGAVALGKTYALTGKQDRFNFSTVKLAVTEGGWELVLAAPHGEQRIPVGFNVWREGSVVFETEKYEKLGGLIGMQSTAASGAWIHPNVFRVRVYFHGGTFRLDYSFTFNPNGTLSLESSLFGMGGGKWTLIGK